MAARCRWASCAPSCRRRPTPGSPRSRDYGTMSFGDVAAAAIRYAREGFAVFEYMATMIKEYEDGYRSLAVERRDLPARRQAAARSATASCRPISPARCNTWSTRSAPQRARGRLAGLAAARAAFYCGDIAETIVRYHEQNGGYLASDDLADFHSRYEAPVKRALARLRGLYLRAVVPGPDAGAGAAHDRGGGRPRRVCSTTAPTTCTSSPRS